MVFSDEPEFRPKVSLDPKADYWFIHSATWNFATPEQYRNKQYDGIMKEIREKAMSAETKTVPIVADSTPDASVSDDFEDTDEKTPLLGSSKN